MSNTVLNEIYEYVGRFVAFPDEKSRVAHTLWIAHTYLMDAFYTTPRLHVTSAERRCGKTTLLNITNLLVNKPVSLLSPSPASLYVLIQYEHPTLLVDEVDTLFARKDISDITAITNSGFQRGARVPRVTLEPTKHVEYFDVFGPMLLAGIDKNNMPDTIEDRSIEIRLKRRRDEKIETFRPRKNGPEAELLRLKLEQWAATALSIAKTKDDPIFPDGIEGREADKWESLLIVGDVDDVNSVDAKNGVGEWAKRARDAALEYHYDKTDIEPASKGEMLLKDISTIFARKSTFQITSAELLSLLLKIDESPWSDYSHGRALSYRGLAKLLKPFKIFPQQDRFNGNDIPTTGYFKADFEDAWNRYEISPTPDLPSTVSTLSTPSTDGDASVAQCIPVWPTLPTVVEVTPKKDPQIGHHQMMDGRSTAVGSHMSIK
jgi:Protein of unknown function (DUF3631)